ncbi:MAG: hypothetical protein VR70_10850 [Rhodospirillaceae bacterium BRH_c57]|nr:MAG: hypothetical protein VR70_10850 [Rhodospirillaceae bacterium BRH_c57]
MQEELHILSPKSGAAFERLCCGVWEALWSCQVEINGRNGQRQNGVDFYAQRPDGWHGVQCKAKGPHAKLSEAEVIAEMRKASGFEPPLRHFEIATSSRRDSSLQEAVRKLSARSVENGGFDVRVVFWEGIEDYLRRFPSVHQNYLSGLFGGDLELTPATRALIEFWMETAKPERIFKNARLLPDLRFDVLLDVDFLIDLECLVENLPYYVGRVSPNFLIVPAVENYKLVVLDVLSLVEGTTAETGFERTLCYHVPDETLPLDDRGHHIEYRKNVLRAVLWHLIPAANAVIDEINKFSLSEVVHPVFDVSEFDASGHPLSAPQRACYPDGFWGYPGIGYVEEFIRSQVPNSKIHLV